MLKETLTEQSLVDKTLELYGKDNRLTKQDIEQIRNYVFGKESTVPRLSSISNFSFSTIDYLEKLFKQGTSDEALRLSAVILTNKGLSWGEYLIPVIFRNQIYPVGLGKTSKNGAERMERMQPIMDKLSSYLGEAEMNRLIEKQLGQSEMRARSAVTPHQLIQALLLLRLYYQANADQAQEGLKRIPEWLRLVVTEDADELRKQLHTAMEPIILRRADYRDRHNATTADLNAEWVSERRAQVVATHFPDGSVNAKELLPRTTLMDTLYLITAALLYRCNLHGGKDRMLASQEEIDQVLLEAVRLLHEVCPLEVRSHLLRMDYNSSKPDELLEGLLPTDEPFSFIEQLADSFKYNMITWRKLLDMIPGHLEESHRAYEILENPFLKLIIHTVLADQGKPLPKGAGTVEQAIIAHLRNKAFSGRFGLMLARYLEGELTLEEYWGDQQNHGLFNRLNKDMNRKQLVIALSFLPLESEAARRLASLISYKGVNTLECVSELYRSYAFDGQKLLETYADHPEVDHQKLLEALVWLNGVTGDTYDYNFMGEEAYQRLLHTYPEAVLGKYDELSTDARELFLSTMLSSWEQQPAELMTKVFLKGLNDSSKKLRKQITAAFTDRVDLQLYKDVYLASKKSGIKEQVLNLIRRLPEAKDAYTELLSKEKNSALRELIQVLLDTAGQGPAHAHAALARQADEKKRSRLSWLSLADLPLLKDTDGQPLSQDIQVYVLLQSLEYNSGPNEMLEEMNVYVQAASLADFSSELIQQWLRMGAPAKEKWVLYLGAMFGDRRLVDLLSREIKGWSESGRGAIAAESVKVMSYVKDLSALMTIDKLGRTIKNRQVKTAAAEALQMAAENAGLTQEQLEDRLITALGFDSKGTQRLSYGARSFLVKVNRDYQLSLVNEETGKVVKSLPVPGEKDDAEQAKEAKTRFTQLKKDLKTMVTLQSQRLEESLSKQRLWSTQEWTDLFVNNVIMHHFAVGLVWGVYENEQLKDTFRYMDDGTFNTVDEEEYELKADVRIGLVHPLELDQEQLEAWKTQLQDYEIEQPFEQLERTVYIVAEDERKSREYAHLPAEEYSPTALPKTLEKYGWYKGAPADGGFYHEMYKAYGELVVELQFSGTSVVYYEGLEDITLTSLEFYRNRHNKYHSYYRDEAMELERVPARVYSETIYDILRATGR